MHDWQPLTDKTTCPEVNETCEALLGNADKLMYRAKEQGKNRAEFMTV
jgi:PleD family two-component response regulator